MIALAPLALLLAAAPGLVYVKRATREETRRASLEATVRTLPPLAQTPWKRLEGPFPIPADGAVDTAAEVKTPGEPPRRWQDAAHLADGVEHTLRTPTYLYRQVTVERETTATLTFGVDNGIRIYVNGVMAHVTISTYIPPVTELGVPVRLRAGLNHLLINAGMRGDTTRFLYRLSPVTDELEQQLAARLDQDFPEISERTYYRLETIEPPRDVALEVGGMAFVGRALHVATRRGEVWVLEDGRWRRFAEGLHEPLGLWAERPDEVYVLQRIEITRLRDTDRDGIADAYEAVAQPWTVSGGHHEYAFGLPRDRRGAFYVAKCALGDLSRATFLGWMLRIDARGETTPWASGLRCPNGVALGPDGELFVTDNQGEYVATGKVYHVARGDFFGHPTSLSSNPLVPAAERPRGEIPVAELDRRRKRPAVLLPYGPMGQSPSEPRFDTTGGKFGPFAGQMFLGDQTNSTVMRIALEKVGGAWQGAVFPFRAGFQSGNNRLAFAPDGSLWVGQTDRGWGATGGKEFGLQRVVWTGRVPLEIQQVSLTREGFDLVFTKPVAGAGDLQRYRVQHFHYPFDKTYGVGPAGHTPVEPRAVRVSPDGRRVALALPAIVPGRIYELRVDGLRATDGEPLLHPLAYYTVNVLRP